MTKEHNVPENETWENLWSSKIASRQSHEQPNDVSLVIYNQLSRHIRCNGLRTVELGAGTGSLSYIMLRDGRAAHVTLIDRSESAIEISRKLFHDSARVTWNREDFFEHQGHYDLVVSAGVLEHFGQVERKALVDVHARLADHVVIIVPADTRWNRHRMAQEQTMKLYGWQEPMNAEEMTTLFESAGLRVVACERFLPSYGFPGTGIRKVGRVIGWLAQRCLPSSAGGLLLCYGVRAT